MGAAWFGARRPVADGFTPTSTSGSPPRGGADGFAFVHPEPEEPTRSATSGGGIGYQRLPNSLAVEFDTLNNFETTRRA